MLKEKITRLEIIWPKGREYVKRWIDRMEIDEQDQGRTMKVFISYKPEEEWKQ